MSVSAALWMPSVQEGAGRLVHLLFTLQYRLMQSEDTCDGRRGE
jgi:hypothetical protein